MDPELLAQILAAQQPQLSSQLLAATGAGLGRTDLNALFSQQGLGLGVGVVDPYALEQAMLQSVERSFSAAEEERARLREARAAEERAIAAKYITVEPPETKLDTVTPLWSADIAASEPLREAFVQLERGSSVDDAVAATGLYDLYGGDTQQWARLESALGQFADEKKIRDAAKLRYQRDLAENEAKAQAEIAALSPLRDVADPDVAAERRKFYSDAGLPLLGLLPSPSEQYQIPVEAGLARARRDRPSGMTLAEEMLSEIQTQRRLPTSTGALVQRPRPESVAPTMGVQGVGLPMRAALENQVGGTPFKGSAARSPALREALSRNTMTREQLIQEAVRRERENAALKAEATARGLARAGRSPYQDAMRQLLSYGALEASA